MQAEAVVAEKALRCKKILKLRNTKNKASIILRGLAVKFKY